MCILNITEGIELFHYKMLGEKSWRKNSETKMKEDIEKSTEMIERRPEILK
jgi:hypothetical protein